MSLPSLPTEVIENIIDQATFYTQALRGFALSCRDLLPRSRYHLFHSIRFYNRTQVYSFYRFLDVHPHVASFVVSLTLSRNLQAGQQSDLEWLLQIIPMRLLQTLPSLRIWKINPQVSNWLVFSSPTLASLKVHGTQIVELSINSVQFQNFAHFADYILAFRGLKILRCEYVEFKTDLDGARLDWVNRRFAARLRLSTLIIGDYVPDYAAMALLQSSPSTLLHLEFDVSGSIKLDIPAAVSEMHELRSLTLSLTVDEWEPEPDGYEDAQSALILRTFHIIKALGLHPKSHLQSLTIRCTKILLSTNPIFDPHSSTLLEYCRELEAALLRLPNLHNIQVHYDRGYDIGDLTSLLEQCLPTLATQRSVTIKCLKPSRRQQASYSHDGFITAVAVSPDSKWIATSSFDGTIILWDIQRRAIIHEWFANLGRVLSLAFSPDSRRLASAGSDGLVAVWDVSSSKVKRVAILEGHSTCVNTCAWSPDGTTIVSGSNDKTVRIWDARTYQQLRSLQDSSANPVEFMRFSPNGRWIASGSESTSCDVWDAAINLHIVLRGHSGHLRNAVFGLATGQIATASTDHTIRIWDVETGGEALVVLEGHTRRVRDVAFSPDGRRVVSVSDDATVKVWDSSNGDLVLSLAAHIDDIWVVHFSPDGKYIASGSEDTTVRLWRASDGTCINMFTEHDGVITCLEYSPDGEILTSGDHKGKVCIHHLRDVIPEENSEVDGLAQSMLY